ncbi:MAG: hypothetical protein A2X13_01800 [Bacteroidetes bacterium GWC2_33_15]|nr:MAG: hypothetical protein A2X10_07825 [Bacteroidetes bacterium GWA2_33_15]OFX52213.1 MAG: hypothetical protein A2X13_01800 [Bacteroidetes bacterium GWC2_33_15]OFX64367.1 MAG: hypothetical protein A2X15_12620 [Bacteroidetes bacterium GWB2_32_14]OFX67772.1 MAG: hypothetical protein A2X14_06445 [Bacteroidetes bacterium GWD2_33_33]HAN19384.1 hypothetical protein [Bacteroidales bacterium]
MICFFIKWIGLNLKAPKVIKNAIINFINYIFKNIQKIRTSMQHKYKNTRNLNRTLIKMFFEIIKFITCRLMQRNNFFNVIRLENE